MLLAACLFIQELINFLLGYLVALFHLHRFCIVQEDCSVITSKE